MDVMILLSVSFPQADCTAICVAVENDHTRLATYLLDSLSEANKEEYIRVSKGNLRGSLLNLLK